MKFENLKMCKFEKNRDRNFNFPTFLLTCFPTLLSYLQLTSFYLLLFSLFNINLTGQDIQKKFNISGYISDIPSVTIDSASKQWIYNNLIHNRLNFKYFPCNGLSMALEVRNRLSSENNLAGNSATAANFATDNGFINLTGNISKGNYYVFNTTADRLWVAYESGKTRFTLGRQRINWGQTLVWNPNDIFNAYSYFDFDYIERPGSDAFRLQYYISEVSSFEIAAKLDKEKELTAAAIYKFNAYEYDFQILGGVLNQTDYVAGIGWSGAISSVAFRGEISYFHPVKNFRDTSGIVLATFSLDYTFSNSLSLVAEYLYDGLKFSNNFSFESLLNAPMTVKNLSFVNHNFVIQATYPITPLLTGSLAGMVFPGITGFYIGPTLSYSLTKNLDASVLDQSFSGKIGGSTLQLSMVYFRLKYSF
jgi:hypothetical protein